MTRVNEFLDEWQLKQRSGLLCVTGEVNILHEFTATLDLEVIRQIVHALSHVTSELMTILERLPRHELRSHIYEDALSIPISIDLKLRHHVALKREKCIFTRGMVRFVFINRDFHNRAYHVGEVEPLGSLTLPDVRFYDYSTMFEFLICFCEFFNSLQDIL